MYKKLSPMHPGEILKTVLDDAGLNAHQTALALRIPANRLTAILNGKRALSADTAMRLGRFFGTSAEMWINLQARYDLHVAEDELWEKVAEEVRPFKRVA
ncbi:MAG: HigA family addiction module antitoxin [Bryobacteraceae bacterium]|jgi:addiction module HigA family antidote